MAHPSWPSFSLPLRRDDFRKLYDHFNETLFDYELPKDISLVRFKSLASAGRASLKIGDNNKATYKIMLSPSVMSSEDHVANVIIHEMIHILMYVRYIATADAKWRNADHGPLFVKEMDRINALGYNVPHLEDDYAVEELDYTVRYVFVHCGMLGVKGTPVIAFQHKKPITKAQIEKLIARLATTFGGRIKHVSSYETKNSKILKVDHLTASNEIPLNKKKPRAYNDNFRQDLEADSKVLITVSNTRGERPRWVNDVAKLMSVKAHKLERHIYYSAVCTYAGKATRNKELDKLSTVIVSKGADPKALDRELNKLQDIVGTDIFKYLDSLFKDVDAKKVFRFHRAYALKTILLLEELILEQGKKPEQAFRNREVRKSMFISRGLMVGRIPMPEIHAFYMNLGLKNTLFPRDQLNTVIKQYFK